MADYEGGRGKVSWFADVIPVYLRMFTSVRFSKPSVIGTCMRVQNVVDVIGTQASSCEALHHIRIGGHWLSCRCVLLYCRCIAIDISPQAKVEHNTRPLAGMPVLMLYQKSQGGYGLPSVFGYWMHKLVLWKRETTGRECMDRHCCFLGWVLSSGRESHCQRPGCMVFELQDKSRALRYIQREDGVVLFCMCWYGMPTALSYPMCHLGDLPHPAAMTK